MPAGNRDHVRAEIDRLRIAASDMRQAAAGARHLGGITTGEVGRMHGDAERALETGVIVSYARPFTRHGIGQLDKAIWTPSDPDQAKLHDELIRLRNVRFAHTDRTDLRGTEDAFGDGQFGEAWVPLNEQAWPKVDELARIQERQFDELARELQRVLTALEVEP